jgi:hypothetical protein
MALKTTITWEEFLAAGELVIDTVPGFALELHALYAQ